MTDPMRQAIGLDIGGTSIRAARVSADGDILAHSAEPTAATAPAILAQIGALIAALDGASVAAIGIGVPGRVNGKTGEIFAGGFVDLSGPALGGRIAGGRGRPVFAANDGTMALVAEAKVGAARSCANVVMLTIGTGIGGAAMLDNAIVHGKATAGQLGHTTVAMNGELCACGRRGCLETMSSGTALRRLIANAGLPAGTSAEDLLTRTDSTARGIISQWIRPLRAGIDSLVVCYDPDVVVLGGGAGHAACTALAAFPAASSWFQSPIVPAALGSKAGVIGAALAALDAGP